MFCATKLPTAEEYLQTITRQEVPVSNEVKQHLKRVVSTSALEIQRVIDAIQQREDVQLRSIISSQAPSSSSPVEANKELSRLREQLSFWTSSEELAKIPQSVFVSPSYAGYHGVAESHSIGINENLLQPSNEQQLVETIRHELLHSITGLHDYKPEFIMLLLELADQNGRVFPPPPNRQATRRPPPPPPPRRS